jgi:ABC-type multidrug transport system fused ATPase/permease subunit
VAASFAHIVQIAAKLRQLLGHLSVRRRRQFALLIALMLVSAVAEVINIGALLPFLAVLASPDVAFSNGMVRAVADLLGIHDARGLLLPMTLGFVFMAVMAGLIRLLLLRMTTRLIFLSGHDLSVEMYRRTLLQPYSVHALRNTSEIVSALTVKANSIMFDILLPMALIVNTLVVVVFLTGTLLYIDFLVATVTATIFVVAYLLIAALSHRKLRANGQIIADQQTKGVKLLQEGLGGIRDVLLDGLQQVYVDHYQAVDRSLRRAQGDNLFFGGSPRYLMEVVGIAAIAGLAYLVSIQGGIAAALPTIGALALGVQRLLPAFQQGYNSWSLITGNQAALKDVLELLEQPVVEVDGTTDTRPLAFNREVSFQDLSFSYANMTDTALNLPKLTIAKGARIGIVGATGSGKSTFLDVFMGLLHPQNGSMLIDGIPLGPSNSPGWQALIAHVPQSIYLLDDTIAANIALGLKPGEIDRSRLAEAARGAQILDYVESLPEGFDTVVGERGARLSGGQRQRLGIARALYKRAPVLVLDEATSALDGDTEKAVMRAIDASAANLTILIVAHRLSTLENCDEILTVKNGAITKSAKPIATDLA